MCNVLALLLNYPGQFSLRVQHIPLTFKHNLTGGFVRFVVCLYVCLCGGGGSYKYVTIEGYVIVSSG
jgi:hypothetical protein